MIGMCKHLAWERFYVVSRIHTPKVSLSRYNQLSLISLPTKNGTIRVDHPPAQNLGPAVTK